MQITDFINILNADAFIGVPDSQLKALCNYLIHTKGICTEHIIAANEGNCVAIAAGYYLATGKIPVVYMQNSGLGNIVNPVASLLNDKVYGIPCIFIIGWRGEPGVHDEPQHIFQGEITLKLLEDMDIATMVIREDTNVDELNKRMQEYKMLLVKGKSVAFVVAKDALSYEAKIEYKNSNTMLREDVIKHIVGIAGEDIIVSTTGKTSRELFEIREQNKDSHKRDFLTVGSMGHSSSLALGIAINTPNKKVWCIDGDGAALMHMGAMAIIGSQKPKNMIHILVNNAAHESVGGMPTVAGKLDMVKIAKGCGYPLAITVDSFEDLNKVLTKVHNGNELAFVEVKAAIGSRADLGRPTTSAKENKEKFIQYLRE